MIYVLDSSIVVAALRSEPRVVRQLEELNVEDLILCAPVLAELLHGAHSSRRSEWNLEHIRMLTGRMRFEPFDRAAAEKCGELRGRLGKIGRQKSDFDMAIAATAIVIGAVLVSHDKAHLDGIPGLTVEDWLAEPGQPLPS